MLEEQLQTPFREAYTQMRDAVMQEGGEDADANEELTLEELTTMVSSTILQGTMEQRQQLAASLTEAQQKFRTESDAASLELFFGCLIAVLLGETPDISFLEPPFTTLWQTFQETLNVSPNEPTQQGEEKNEQTN